MSDPCCAHLHVSYRTEELPNFGTHGWWACDACGKRFAPISNTLSDGETVRPIDACAGINRASDLRRDAGLREAAQQARCPECLVPLDCVTMHDSECTWQAEQARLARPSTRTYGNELTNAYRPNAEMSREELEQIYPAGIHIPPAPLPPSLEEWLAELRQPLTEPEEIAPASWWSRVKERFL